MLRKLKRLRSEIKIKIPATVSNPTQFRMYVYGGIVIGCTVAFTFGVGAAAILDSPVLAKINNGNGDNKELAKIRVTSSGTPTKQITFRVEIVRDGKILCSAPEIKVSGDNPNAYNLTRPASTCQPIQDGDAVRTIWSQTNETKISYK